jgi:hypothetical protein
MLVWIFKQRKHPVADQIDGCLVPCHLYGLAIRISPAIPLTIRDKSLPNIDVPLITTELQSRREFLSPPWRGTPMTDDTLLVLLDVLDGLAGGYRECSEKLLYDEEFL